MERLHARPALQADLRTLATAIESAIHEKSEELAGWLGELIAGVTELHQDSPEASAAWRDGLVAVLRQAWERHQAEQGVIADALAGAWVGASVAAEQLGAPATTPEVRAVLAELHTAAHGLAAIDRQIVARDRRGNAIVIAEEVTTVEDTCDLAPDGDRS